MNSLLKGLTVIDFTHRLPGPLASHLLSLYGATVHKVEDARFGDAFKNGMFAEMESSFPAWYEELNRGKAIESLDFNSPQGVARVQELLARADAVLMGPPPKVRTKIGITREDLERLGQKRPRPLVVVELLASREGPDSLHDLNALALAGLLPLHVDGATAPMLAPPFLPVAGIGFGHKVATDILALLWKAGQSDTPVHFMDCYLLEATRDLFGPFWPETVREKGEKKFLHNGRYPCYNIYRTRDGHYLSLAAVEEKFWARLCQLLSWPFSLEDRFHHVDQRVFDGVIKTFSSLNAGEIKALVGNEDVCLSFI